MFQLLLAIPLIALMVQAPDARDAYLYRTLLVRAAPGALLEVIDLYRDQMPTYEAAGERPFIMRHSQGDQWDLLLLFPMGSFADYYSPSSIARRARVGGVRDLWGRVSAGAGRTHRLARGTLRAGAVRYVHRVTRPGILTRSASTWTSSTSRRAPIFRMSARKKRHWPSGGVVCSSQPQ